MKKLTIVVPDDKVALVERLVEAVPGMEIVEVKDMDSIEEFQRKSPMERLDFAIRSVDSEKGLLANRYDFAWLYAAIQQGQLKGIKKYKSVESFRQHLNNIGINVGMVICAINIPIGCSLIVMQRKDKGESMSQSVF